MVNSIYNEDTIPGKTLDHDYYHFNISKRGTTYRYNNIQTIHYDFNKIMKRDLLYIIY